MRPGLLLESGAVQASEAAAFLSKADLVLSRALCRFKLFRAASGLPRRQVDRAARLFAETHAPFAETGTLLLRTKQGAAIWYWDRQKLSALPALREVSPESVWRAPFAGWRVLSCAEGFEAQYWDGAGLAASSWRREPFGAPQWAAFVLSVEGFETEPPDAPPPPVLPPAVSAAWRRAKIGRPLSWRDLQTAAATAAFCFSALTALFVGQTVSYSLAARAEERAVADLEQRIREDPSIARAQGNGELLRGYADARGDVGALAGAVEALTVIHSFGLQPVSWRVDSSEFRALVEASIADTPVRDLAAALEASPRLCAVTPELASGGMFELRARIAPSGDAGCEPSLRGRSR